MVYVGEHSRSHRVLLELLVHVSEGMVDHAVVSLVRPVCKEKTRAHVGRKNDDNDNRNRNELVKHGTRRVLFMGGAR